MKLHCAFIALAVAWAVACPAHADCGGENLMVSGPQIRNTVLRSMIGVLTFYGPHSPQTNELIGYTDSAFKTGKRVKKGDLKPVSVGPVCGERVGLDGYRFPILEVSTDAIRVVYAADSGETIWLKRSETETRFRLMQTLFGGMSQNDAVSVHFLHGDPLLFRKPYLSSGRSTWPQGANMFRVLHEYQGFVELGSGGWEGQPMQSIGWMLLRDDKGLIQIWPSLYDDD